MFKHNPHRLPLETEASHPIITSIFMKFEKNGGVTRDSPITFLQQSHYSMCTISFGAFCFCNIFISELECKKKQQKKTKRKFDPFAPK